MKKYIAFALLLLAGITIWYYHAHPLVTQVEINGNKFIVELAITEAERQKGLGYRDSLADNRGMLFVYDHPEQHRFWMKGMRFPIDIIWIENKKIIDISANVPISDDVILPTYAPKLPVSQILELNAGTVDRLGIKIGDTVQILKN